MNLTGRQVSKFSVESKVLILASKTKTVSIQLASKSTDSKLNTANWALCHLTKKGSLTRVNRGIYAITLKGKAIADKLKKLKK